MSKKTNELSWEYIQETYTLEETLRALRWYESNKKAHTKYYERRKAILARAKELGLDKEI
jgi:hypothetical protein